MNAKSMILGFAPWVVFSVVAERAGAGYVALAALLAAAVALVLTIYEASRRSWKLLDVVGVATFAVIAAIALAGDRQTDGLLVDFGRGGSTYVLAVVMAISAYTVPFTEQYARQTVDPTLWHSPVFRAKNKRISLLWAGVVFLIATSHMIAGALTRATDIAGAHPGNILLNWVVPIVLIMYAVKQTRAIADASATSRVDA